MEKTSTEKFWRSSSTEGPWLRVAQIVSLLTNPLLIAIPICLVVALSTAPNVKQALLWGTATTIGFVALLLFIWQGVRRGTFTDHHVSRREQRLIPLVVAVGCLGIVIGLLLLLHASPALLATITASIISCTISALITSFWKISLHVVGIAGAVTTLGLVVGPLLFLLAPLVLLVGWARWRVEAHIPLQALAGTVLAVGITVATFWLFGVL